MPLLDLPFPPPLPLPRPEPRPFPFPFPFPGPWFVECTPRVLVVTDSLGFQAGNPFGLTEFVATLRASTIHGMTPEVRTASFNPSPLAALSWDPAALHLTNYKFKDPAHGLVKGRYDVVFILAIRGESGAALTDEPGALEAVTAFMQAGGGLFATGDHEDLGAGMCMHLPRVRSMRHWRSTGPGSAPGAATPDRLTTTLPGSDDSYQFSDQSDHLPQRLYANFRTEAGGIGAPHPLLQVPGHGRAIEVFPDHPHEGECVVPTDLATRLPDGVTDEWPEAGGARVSPELVALTMSSGNTLSGKAPVTPRSFVAVCAYDGQRADVGRVVTDATWHHFVNINVQPGVSALGGRDLEDIKQYYVNLATWLMPKTTRLCRRFPWIIKELVRYPLFEELMPRARERLDGPKLHAIGAQVQASLAHRHTRAEVQALVDDALEEALGPQAVSRLRLQGGEAGAAAALGAGLAALGSLTLATAQRFNELKDKSDLDAEQAFAPLGRSASAAGAKQYLAHERERLGKMNELLESIVR